MPVSNLRYLQHTERARIEHDLTLTRLGELMVRDINLALKGTIYSADPEDVVYFFGLKSTSGGGMDVSLSTPASVVQKLDGGDVKYCIDSHGGAAWTVAIDAADPVQDRYDIIEGQIKTRSEFTDTSVDIADPITKVITPMTRDRDFEIYLDFQKKTGTPGAGVPPTPTAGTAGLITGTVAIPTTLDLSAVYIINFTIGIDGEFAEVDCRGAVPAATTKAEIIAALNAAGFGVVATISGNFIVITAPGTGEGSIVKIKQPTNPSIDAYAEIFGGIEGLGYYDVFKGTNAWFKVAEIEVPAGVIALTNAEIRSRDESATWISDAATIVNAMTYEEHRESTEMDHVDASVYWRHLNADARNKLQAKLTEFDTLSYAKLYQEMTDVLKQSGRVYMSDQKIVKSTGDDNTLGDQEQLYPRSRLDQRQETFGGGNYTTLTAISEAPADIITFSPTLSTALRYSLNHNRGGIYMSVKGSGYTHLRMTLHNATNTQLATYTWTFASLSVGWVYFDLPATLQDGQTYHYHVFVDGFTGGGTAQLGTNGGGARAFRELYKPTAGVYGGPNTYDVLHVLASTMIDIVAANGATVDDMVVCGDGYSSLTAYDIMSVDFSNIPTWVAWQYNNYIGVDLSLGRVKLPAALLPGENITTCFGVYFSSVNINTMSTKEIYKHGTSESLEDWLWRDFVDEDVTLAANSDSRVPSQKAVKTYADAISTRRGLQIYTSGSGNWTVPAGVVRAKVTVVGGGGGGGNTTEFGGCGGGGGGAAIKLFTTVPGNNLAYSVGAGGASSSVGGTTSFSTISATGGYDGCDTGESSGGTKGKGGVGSGGDINIVGGSGGIGDFKGGYALSGQGGSSILGGGGGYSVHFAFVIGQNGGNYGGGGGGGITMDLGFLILGGAGAGGIVIIEW